MPAELFSFKDIKAIKGFDPYSIGISLAFYGLKSLAGGVPGFKPGFVRETHGGRKVWSKYSDPITPDTTGVLFYAAVSEMIKDNGTQITEGAESSGHNFSEPPWIFKHHSDRVQGLNTSSVYQNTADTFGSFRDAVADLNDRIGDAVGWKICYRHLTPERPEDMAIRLMRQAPISFWKSIFTGKWMCHVYQSSPPSWTYHLDADGNATKWTFDDFADEPEIFQTSREECINEVHIMWGLFAPTGEFTRDTWVGPSGSDDGSGTRDQNTTAPENREALAAASKSDYKVKSSVVLECPDIDRQTVAIQMRNYIFDRFSNPRITIVFRTWNKAYGLEPCMTTKISNTLQDYRPCPKYSTSGSPVAWEDLDFFVVSCDRIATSAGDLYEVVLEEIIGESITHV